MTKRPERRRLGDRKDGRLVRDDDGMHVMMPYMYLNRTDSEAFISETVDMTAVDAYVEKKNRELKAKVKKGELPKEALDDPYKMFQIVLAALIKTVTLRPKMNRFIANHRTYQRDKVSVAFVVKKRYADDAREGLAFKAFGPETTINSLHESIVKEINMCRDENQKDNSSDFLDKFAKLPAFLLRFLFVWIRLFDRKGMMPATLVKTDPDYATIFVTNLGSIGLKAGYHHLNNWGTNSFFVIIGKKEEREVKLENGKTEKRQMMDIGLTIDERIADGFYFAQTIKLFKKIIENPELLEERADKEVEF